MGDDVENNDVQVPEIDYDKLGASVAAAMAAKQETPAAAAPEPTPDLKANEGGDNADLLGSIGKMLDERNADGANDAIELMFENQVTQLEQNTPGFADYLNQKDDYGKVRRDELNSIKDPRDRMDMIRSLNASFSEASANVQGRKPAVNTREQKMAEDMQSKFDDLYARWGKGELDENQYSEEHVKLINEESAMLRGSA